VVVYKVDRLTRSLADFARLVEIFDAQGVSFVSVTQQFNTTSWMGRLTLNVLLSFAQFETRSGANTPGMADEMHAMSRYLCDHAVRPEFTCRFRWQTGSLAFWDNRAVQHNAINDYHGRRRLMHRVTIEGERPV
jgi:Taurine catabolism dioxygenase TauD, TfdA family/Resolvase, N terminal domain